MGAAVPKQYHFLRGEPVLVHVLRAFAAVPGMGPAILVVSESYCDEVVETVLKPHHIDNVLKIVPGGKERQDSVQAGLAAVPADCRLVLIHDGVRPLVNVELIQAAVEAGKKHRAAAPSLPVSDTLKTIDSNGAVAETLERARIRAIQTPQAFEISLLRAAHEKAAERAVYGTDDAALVEALGHPVALFPGDAMNIKITGPQDLIVAEALLRSREAGKSSGFTLSGQSSAEVGMSRIGQGYDAHRFVQGRPLILGGVLIPHSMGLKGHSDADVAAHAIGDALLGALSLGDLGAHFPDSDQQFKGISSLVLIERIVAMLGDRGYAVANVDCTVIAQKPRIAEYVPAMRKALAAALAADETAVSLKATTTEGLGFEGRGEGISAHAVAQIIHLEVCGG